MNERISTWRSIAFCALLSLAATPLWAGIDPVNARGIALDKVYDFNQFDAINTFNGNLTFNIPIGPEYRVGDGLKYQFHLTYNSALWEQEDIDPVDASAPGWMDPLVAPSDNRVETVPNRWFNAGLGWHVTLGELRRGEVRNQKWIYTYVSPDGASHLFYNGLHVTENALPDPEVSYTRDGTYMRLRRVGTNNDRIVETPDGVQRYFQCVNDCSGAEPEFRLTKLTDPLGNTLAMSTTVSSTSMTWTFTETSTGGSTRTHEILFEKSSLKIPDNVNVDGYVRPLRWTRWRVDKITLAAPAGSVANDKAIYDFTYKTNGAVYREGSQTIDWLNYGTYPSLVQWNKNAAGKDDYSIDVDLLEKVSFPAGGLEWNFAYYGNHEGEAGQHKDTVDSTNRHPWSDIAGRMKTVTLPSKGTITYKYGRRPFPTRTCQGNEWDPEIPTPSAGGRFHGEVGIIRRTEGQSVTFYGGFTRDGLQRPTGDPCWVDNEYLGVVVDPAGKATVNYYSIGLLDPYGMEYGLPYARSTPPDAGGRYLSQDIWGCKGDFMWRDGSALRNDLTYSQAQTKLKSIARDKACAADSANPVPLRSTWVKYEWSEVTCMGDYSGPDCSQANRRETKRRVIYYDDGGTYADVESDGGTTDTGFDGLGHFRTVTTNGTFNASTFPSNTPSEARTTFKNFNPGKSVAKVPIKASTDPWILGTYTEEQQKNASGTILQRAWFDFDTNGFLNAKRIAVGSALGAKDVLAKYERTVCGSGCSAADQNSIIIVESNYGGDTATQALSTADSAKFNAPAAGPVYKEKHRIRYGSEEYVAYLSGTNEFLLKAKNTIDANTGLVKRQEDASGLGTSYTYDAIGRPTLISPDAQATIGYDYSFLADDAGNSRPALRITRPSCPSPCVAGAAFYDLTAKFDAFGRLTSQRQIVATTGGASPGSATAVRTISYLPNGWKEKESTVKNSNAASQDFTYYGSYNPNTRLYGGYDVFGRSTQISAPDSDGKSVVTKFEYKGEREVKTTKKIGTGKNGRSDVDRWEERDGYGNLVQIIESTSASQGDLVTRYDYDYANRIVSVIQGKPSQSAAKQTRDIYYDGRGFLIGERFPELPTGATISGVKYGNFDPRGHFKSRTYGTSTLNGLEFEYDAAERPLNVKPLGGTKLLKKYEYHTSNTDTTCATGKMIGRLAKTVRYNTVKNPNKTFQDIKVNVQRFYSYGADGNLSALYTGVTSPALGMQNVTFRSTYDWDDVGNLTSISYPSCNGCTGLTETPKTILPTYSHGQLVSIPGYANRIDYHVNGVVAKVWHVNGVNDVTNIDENGLQRPSAMFTTGVSSGPNWNPSSSDRARGYDGAGNLTKAGSDWFTYDGASRLTSACVGGVRQDYTIDEWGNLKTIQTYNDCSATSLTVSRDNGINDATNRFGTIKKTVTGQATVNSATTYDAFGNVTKIGRDQYDYDVFNMVTHAHTVDGLGQTTLGKIFVYDADDQRVAIADYRTPGTSSSGAAIWKTKWTWAARGVGGQILREFERIDEPTGVAGPWTQGTDYVYANGRLLATTGPGGARDYHTDHLGTPRLITNSAGQNVGMHTYFPFGEEITAPDRDASRMRFTGHERDNNNTTPNTQDGDLDYMHARYYAPVTGRFLSIDPAGISIENPQSWNRYAYCLNDPVNGADPTGRATVRQWQTGGWAHGAEAPLEHASYTVSAEAGDVSIDFTAVDDVNGEQGFKICATYDGKYEIGFKKIKLPGGVEVSLGADGKFTLKVAGIGVEVGDGESKISLGVVGFSRSFKEDMKGEEYGTETTSKVKGQVGPFKWSSTLSDFWNNEKPKGTLDASWAVSIGGKMESCAFINVSSVWGHAFNAYMQGSKAFVSPEPGQ